MTLPEYPKRRADILKINIISYSLTKILINLCKQHTFENKQRTKTSTGLSK